MSEFPFNNPLKDSKYTEESSRLKTFEGNEDLIVRFIPFKRTPKDFEDIKDPFETVLRIKELYTEINDKYKIPVSFKLVVGKNKDGEEGTYIITEVINGENLKKAEFNEEEREYSIKETNIFLENLLKYHQDKFQSRGYFLDDICTPFQFVYGVRKNETDKKIHLVDVDFLFYVNLNKKHFDEFLVSLFDFTNLMMLMEEKLNVKFEEIRKNLLDFLKEIRSDETVFANNLSSIDHMNDLLDTSKK
jgi:hypothetical protein